MKKTLVATSLLLGLLLVPFSVASAATMIADTIIDFYDSGLGPAGSTPPYWAGPADNKAWSTAPFSYVTDGNPNTYISLPTGSYITLGFSEGVCVDGDGYDLFFAEVGANRENAEVWISSDWGETFTYLGIAYGGVVTRLDLATIGYSDAVNAVKVIGLDNLGASPGFDLAYVQGLEGSVIINPDIPSAVPEPSTWVLLVTGLLFAGIVRRQHFSSRI